MIERIAILGGSSVYIPEFVMSLVSHNVNVREIVLMGHEERKLAIVAAFCERLVHRSGFPTAIVPSTNVEEAVTGARYVVNHIRVGGMRARLRDEKLPPEHGMVGDDGLGAGGFANAMRTLPVVLDMARRIEAVNPDALFINLTNPMGIVMQALSQRTKLRCIGACDMPSSTVRRVAEIVKIPLNELEVDFIGLDRLGWIQDIKHLDRSMMSLALEKIAQNGADEEIDKELTELFRLIPTRSAALYFRQEAALKRQRTAGRHRAEVLFEAEKQILTLYEDKSLNEIPELTRQRNAVWYEETIVPLIVALESKNESSVILSVTNGDAIRDLPEMASVEIPVTVSNKGPKPRKVGSCPRFLKGLFAAVKESDRLAVEAASHKSYDMALQALAINPFVPSLCAAKAFLNVMMKEENLELH